MSKRKKIAIAVAVPVTLILLAAGMYIGYFTLGKRALPRTCIGETNVAGLTQQEIEERLNHAAQEKTVTVSGEGITTTTSTLADMGFSFDSKKIAEQALSSNSHPLSYVKNPLFSRVLTPDITIHKETASKFAHSLTEGNESAVAPIEPTLEFTSEEFRITEGKNGVGVDPRELKNAAYQLAATLSDINYSASISDVEPLMQPSELQPKLEAANELIDIPVSLQFNDKTFSASAEDKAQWLSLDSEQPTISAQTVKTWVQTQADTFTIKGITGIRYLNSSGEIVKVKREAIQGVTVNNVDSITEDIVKNLAEKAATNASFTTTTEQVQWEEKVVALGAENLPYPAPEGERWVDINLSNHSVNLYEGATLISIYPMISGSPATPTPTGEFSVYAQLTIQTMRGKNADGSEYETKDVPWVTYFNGDIATHGSSAWRSSWGYDAGYGGSHGCVNMSNEGARAVFDFASVGTAVTVHY